MKETGIVRRIDDLGRLVIPKEIRKKYQLQEGDEVEIYTQEEQIILRKYQALENHIKDLVTMCDVLTQVLHKKVLFVQDEYLKQIHVILNEGFIKLCKEHHTIHFTNEEVFEQQKRANGWIVPVVVYGEWYGAFVIIEEEDKVKEEELKFVELFVQFISRQQM